MTTLSDGALPSHDRAAALLALCARARPHSAQSERLAQVAETMPDWGDLAARAEAHGLAPLLYAHLRAANVELPPAVRQQLLGYYVQHAHAARVREQALIDILTACNEAGIDVLLLKGAALAYLVYPQAVLRPMRDIDILVRAEDLDRACVLLPQIGFAPPPGAHCGPGSGHHHLAAISRVAEGFPVSVEVHHTLPLNQSGDPLRYPACAAGKQSFVLSGVTAHTLSREETLWHIYRHAFCMPLGCEPLRLIWVADLISLVEAWVDVLDWERVRGQYPAAYRVLPLLHSLSPWADGVVERLRLPVGRLPAGAGAGYQGWPLFSLTGQRNKGFARMLRDSIFPSPWWLRMYYGHGPSLAGYWQAWCAHQYRLWAQIGHVLWSE